MKHVARARSYIRARHAKEQRDLCRIAMGTAVDDHAGERERRAAQYAARVREVEELIGSWAYDGSPREELLERALSRVTIFGE